MKKAVIIKIGTGFLILVFVVAPVIEKAPPPHTVEPWYPTTQGVPSVMTFSGSYAASPVSGTYSLPVAGSQAPPAFFTYTGSWS